jgi:hypothetical protein
MENMVEWGERVNRRRPLIVVVVVVLFMMTKQW